MTSAMAQFTVLGYWRSYNHFKVVAVLLIVIGIFKNSEGLRMCYHCDTGENGLACVHNPSNITGGEVSCKGYCTIRRMEYVNMPEGASLISLHRKCEKSPQILDSVVLDSYYTIYYRSCKNYLCNGGSGIQSLRDIPVDLAWDLYPDEELDSNKGSFHSLAFSLFLLGFLILLFV